MAVHVSNIVNLVLFAAKAYASIMSRSLSVIASTFDSLLDLLSGFIFWFTANAMKNPNQFRYPIGKKRMQPVSIIVFASVMATLGLQILLESGRQLASKFINQKQQRSIFRCLTNSVGLAAAVLAVRFFWWIDPTGAIIIALYTINTWAKTVLENLTYLIWNHHEEIKHIDTVRAYTFGSHNLVEADIVLPEDLLLNKAHNIGETLQEKLEQLPEVERAFVHIDFEFTHGPEHKNSVW
ncbi:hypothetical protein ACFX14_035919 [Malus domestica]